MANKFRLKIKYREESITVDIDAINTFDQLRLLIHKRFDLPVTKDYAFVHEYIILASDSLDETTLDEKLELGQNIHYITSDGTHTYRIDINVWDYIFETSDETMKKFMKLAKNMDRVRPKQKYYLSSSQRSFIDKTLNDCYGTLKSLSFSGIYNYHLVKNGTSYLWIRVIYYILHDKYEIRVYNDLDDQKNDKYEYLFTFYDANRAYFKGYQGNYRNIFVLHRDDTLKKEDFEFVYYFLNLIIYMLSTVDQDLLFESHEDYLEYDLATETVKTVTQM